MGFLLDTCAFLWMLSDAARLGPEARRRILDPASRLFLSAASSWDIAIKIGIGKLTLPEPISRVVLEHMQRNSIDPLPVQHEHALGVGGLPVHHRDPFDRMLISQAIAGSLAIVTPDPLITQYPVRVLG